jgi:hypothetical protein
LTATVLGLACIIAGCGPTVTIKHEVQPIHLTVDVNIRVQKELEKFFDFEESRGSEGEAAKAEAE